MKKRFRNCDSRAACRVWLADPVVPGGRAIDFSQTRRRVRVPAPEPARVGFVRAFRSAGHSGHVVVHGLGNVCGEKTKKKRTAYGPVPRLYYLHATRNNIMRSPCCVQAKTCRLCTRIPSSIQNGISILRH